METRKIEAELLDVRAAAALLSVSVRSVWRLKDSGRMPLPLKVGGAVRWRRADLLSWIENGCLDMRATGRVRS